MKIRLLDYADHAKYCEIPDDTEEIAISVISGDMVMTYPIYCDSSNDRVMDFNYGSTIISKENFDKLNNIHNSYEVFDI